MELAEKLTRAGSLIDPQEQLLKYFQRRNHEKFCSVLESAEVDVNYFYDEPECGTILDLCTTQENTSEFLRSVLSTKAVNPNKLNRFRKKAPLHFLLERGDTKNLSIMLKFLDKVDVNIVDSFGETPLHYAAKNQKNMTATVDIKALQMLLNVSHINKNVANRKGQTPTHLAALQGNKDALLILIWSEGVDLESSRDFNNKTAKELIMENYSDILLPDKSINSIPVSITPDYVFSLLRANNTDVFKKTVSENLDLINASDGINTLLQYSCNHGLFDIVNFLVQSGADVNKTCESKSYTPIMLASRKGYHRIVQRLLKSNVNLSYISVNMENIFHCVVSGSVESNEMGDSEEDRDHLECLDILVSHLPKTDLINRGDFKGNTPLHHAGRLGNDEMIFRLLDIGAYTGCVNIFGDPALAYISASVFKRYLDKCVSTNNKKPREEGYEIVINHKCFVHPINNSFNSYENPQTPSESSGQNLTSKLYETDLLLYISESYDLKHLLMHPVIRSLIFMKWFSIRKWFYVNLLFYLCFWGFLSAYILGVYDGVNDKSMSNTNRTTSHEDSSRTNPAKSILWPLVALFLLLLIVRELFQFKKAYLSYVLNPENWLELGLIALTIVILFVSVHDETKHQLAAVAILFSWTELVLLIGKHPALSTHIEMLKTVGGNFLKFLAWYSILIVAFALSFYTLFRNDREEDEENAVFIDPGVSIFKTIVMLTGEFEAGEIPFHRYPFTGHMLFVLFVFAIAIVLYNLLNGLAVSDTQAIKSDAEMVAYISRIKLVSYIESIDILPSKQFARNFKSCNFFKNNRTRDNLSCDKTIYSLMKDHEIHIFPNERNKIELSSAPTRPKRNDLEDPPNCFLTNTCYDNIMDSSIIRSAQDLLNTRLNTVDSCTDFGRYSINDTILNEYEKTLEGYKNILKQMTETEKRIRDLMNSLDANLKPSTIS